MTSFYVKNGYDVEITLGNQLLTTSNGAFANGLHGAINIVASENSSRTAMFSIIPPQTSFTLLDFKGKPVKIMIRTAADGWQQVFTGWVDSPKFNFIDRNIQLNCTDRRTDRIIQLPQGVVSTIGTYSEDVFGNFQTRADELDFRLQTVAASFDFDRFGAGTLTPWQPKASADYTFTNSLVSRNISPTVEFIVDEKAINRIKIVVDYKYQRLHQQTVRVSWVGFTSFANSWYSQGRPTFPARQTVYAAASATDWKVVPSPGTDGINFTALWADGYYRIEGVNVHWSPDDLTNSLCRGAAWQAAIRFAQNVTEHYELTVSAPQVIAQVGIVDRTEQITITDPYDAQTWEQSALVSTATDNYYTDKNSTAARVTAAINTSLHKAKHDLLEKQRNMDITFRTKTIKPVVDLQHTVRLNVTQATTNSSAAIDGTGKVSIVKHNINIDTLEAYTEITLKLTQSTGSATNTAFSYSAPTTSPSYIGAIPTAVGLQTYLGVDPALDPNTIATGAGWFANKYTSRVEYSKMGAPTFFTTQNTIYYKTAFTEKFVVEYPKIPDGLRLDATYYASNSYDVVIPNDSLTVSL